MELSLPFYLSLPMLSEYQSNGVFCLPRSLSLIRWNIIDCAAQIIFFRQLLIRSLAATWVSNNTAKHFWYKLYDTLVSLTDNWFVGWTTPQNIPTVSGMKLVKGLALLSAVVFTSSVKWVRSFNCASTGYTYMLQSTNPAIMILDHVPP